MRLYIGGFGHHPSGKMYSYWGNDNFRTGQNVVAPVMNKRTGKIYNTMFTIMRTSGGDGKIANDEQQRLLQKGISIKHIQGTDILNNLPGGSRFESKTEWAKDSESRYNEKLFQRLSSRPNPSNNENITQRILEKND